NYNNTSEIYKEYCAMTKGSNIDITHLNYDRLKTEGTFQWPVPSYKHSGTKRLFEDKKFYTPSQKAIFNIPSFIKNVSDPTNEKYPLILTTGRVRDQWHTMTKTGKVSRLKTHYPSPVLEINQVDAFLYKVKDGDVVEIKSKNGVVRVRAKVSENIKRGVVFLPMHWGKQLQSDLNRSNNLTNTIVDPISKEPDFKYTIVSVSKYKKSKEKIIVVGAGAASFRFVQNYREHSEVDEIHVFSKEEHPFYNRVLLPEYVTDELTWEQLLKIKKLEKLNINLHARTHIVEIDNEKKQVKDNNGVLHRFDKLILATGSRAFIPNDVQLNLPGRFTLRSKTDADRFKTYLESTNLPPEEQHVTIVGGGLLGLELAAALKHKNINITIVQRASWLMERQLDLMSSKLLAMHVRELGIQIYFSNEVSTVFNDEETNDLNITLKSGKSFKSNAIVYAIGTRTNIEIAKASGIVCGRGIKINQHLQSSNPDVFAIGEIAEFNNDLLGITSAAEEQATILANFLAGDIGSVYSGSVAMNILKFSDLDLCSLGDIIIPENDEGYEEIVLLDMSKRYYKKCIVKDDLLVGAILMGDKNEFAEYKTLIESKVELSEKRDTLLRGTSNAKPVLGKLVCSCSQIGEGNLMETIANGCSDFTELCKQTGAGLGCGSCKTEVREILQNSSVLA
ncbi:MAG TPA: FAD-dependent oxidoreductase, partial [Flavobacteriaceae bacterium]|nr:FAD-dependent oxidoreductase [Flavobacteriaceae bacterium]